MGSIEFFYEEVTFRIPETSLIDSWLKEIATNKGFELRYINYIICTDEYLLDINQQHLNHDYYTDIITFDQSEDEHTIEADIFISIERVLENANEHKTEAHRELLRVLAHGLLHLCGLKDKSPAEAKEMRKEEDLALLTISVPWVL